MHLNSSRNPFQSAGTLSSQQEPYLVVSRNPSWSAGTLLLCITPEIYPPELQQEPFVVSRNLTLKSAGTLCGQQEPMMLAGTLLCSQQEPHTVSRNPLWPAGTLDVNRNHAQQGQRFLHCYELVAIPVNFLHIPHLHYGKLTSIGLFRLIQRGRI